MSVNGPVPSSIAPMGGIPRQQRAFKTQDKPDEVRRSNMNAAKAVSDAIRTSLGPKGMDKMVSRESKPLGDIFEAERTPFRSKRHLAKLSLQTMERQF